MNKPSKEGSESHLEIGSVVQLSPSVGNPMFACCMLTVTDIREWGVQGFVQSLGEGGEPGGQAFYRAKWKEIEYVGKAVWSIK